MAEELSGIAVVIIIGCGVLTFILLFIFAKRQIMRFALRSRRGPYVPIGHAAKKSLKRELERRVDIIPRIVHEPQLIIGNDSRYILQPGREVVPYYFRLKAVDDIKLLEQEITKQDSCLVRHPTENLRSFLLTSLAAPLNGLSPKLVQQFCDLYEQARHDPNEFGDEEYQVYSKLLLKLTDLAKMLKSYPNSRKSSPNRTPQKRGQDKTYRFLLDAQLRSEKKPPPEDEVLCVSENDARPVTLPVSPEDKNETSV